MGINLNNKMVMNYIIKTTVIFCVSLFIIACEYDMNAGFDMSSPQAVIAVDTLEVAKGETVTLQATLSDKSGLLSCMLDYSKWEIASEIKLKDDGYPKTYNFVSEITVPEDAETSWQENYQKHDGSIFEITQTYHKLSLTFYDAVNNKNVVYFYIKVLQ
jgi:hypothetical protein